MLERKQHAHIVEMHYLKNQIPRWFSMGYLTYYVVIVHRNDILY